MAKTKTKIKLLEEALKGLITYIKSPDYNEAIASQYLTDLKTWLDVPEADSSNPPPPPPPPPGH